jgi:CspA family cold shock protein
MTQVTVKWYNPKKGFGFVRPDEGQPDAFLHVSVVEAKALDRLPEGTRLDCALVEGPKGWEVEHINDVVDVPAPALAKPPEAVSDGVPGVVKFFNAYKGFGFVTRTSDQADVFVHVRTLEQCGLFDLVEGQGVTMTVSDGPKGLQADLIAVVSEPERPTGPLVRWRPTYAVGCADSDVEHRDLVQQVNGLHDRWQGGAGRDELGRLFDRLIASAVGHLEREDERRGAGPSEALAASRWRWVKDMLDFRQRHLPASARPVALTADMAEFLRAWVMAHVLAETGAQPRPVGAVAGG